MDEHFHQAGETESAASWDLDEIPVRGKLLGWVTVGAMLLAACVLLTSALVALGSLTASVGCTAVGLVGLVLELRAGAASRREQRVVAEREQLREQRLRVPLSPSGLQQSVSL